MAVAGRAPALQAAAGAERQYVCSEVVQHLSTQGRGFPSTKHTPAGTSPAILCSVHGAQGRGAKHSHMQPQKGPDGTFWEQSLSSLWRHSRVATSFLNDNIQGKARQEHSRLLPAKTVLIEWRNSLR